MKKEKSKTVFELAVEEFFSAAAEVRRARTNFNNATPEFFEVANAELSVAIAKFEAIQKKVKMLA